MDHATVMAYSTDRLYARQILRITDTSSYLPERYVFYELALEVFKSPALSEQGTGKIKDYLIQCVVRIVEPLPHLMSILLSPLVTALSTLENLAIRILGSVKLLTPNPGNNHVLKLLKSLACVLKLQRHLKLLETFRSTLCRGEKNRFPRVKL